MYACPQTLSEVSQQAAAAWIDLARAPPDAEPRMARPSNIAFVSVHIQAIHHFGRQSSAFRHLDPLMSNREVVLCILCIVLSAELRLSPRVLISFMCSQKRFITQSYKCSAYRSTRDRLYMIKRWLRSQAPNRER